MYETEDSVSGIVDGAAVSPLLASFAGAVPRRRAALPAGSMRENVKRKGRAFMIFTSAFGVICKTASPLQAMSSSPLQMPRTSDQDPASTSSTKMRSGGMADGLKPSRVSSSFATTAIIVVSAAGGVGERCLRPHRLPTEGEAPDDGKAGTAAVSVVPAAPLARESGVAGV